MQGTILNREIGRYQCNLYLPPRYGISADPFPVIYLNGGGNIEEILERVEPYFGLECSDFLLVNIQPDNWQDDYSPWPASSVMGDGKSFGGNALPYLKALSDTIKPEIDAQYRTKKDSSNTSLMGYSLAGLAALYSLYSCNTFGKIACISGSLWYAGWKEFMEAHPPLNNRAEIYLSLGRGESRSRNPVLAGVGECTAAAAELLSRQLAPDGKVKLEWNNGGHFSEIPQRYQKAILWLMDCREAYG